MLNRQVAPKLTPIKSIEFAVPEVVEIKKGIPLYWTKNIANETAKIELHFHAGTTVKTPIVASLTAGLLIAGTKKKTAVQIQHALDAVGAYYDVSVSQEQAIVTIYALNSYLLQAFDIFQEAFMHAAFPEKELKELSNERQEKLKVQLQKVNVLAQRKIQQVLFEETPYAQVISQGDYLTIRRSDLIQFHQENYLNGLAKVFLVGNLSNDDMQAMKNTCAAFAGTQAKPVKGQFSMKSHMVHEDKKDALQTAIRIGKIMFNKTHPDFIPFSVLNTILGDYFGSRLMSNIREDKGYTYGIGSYMMENTHFGYFMIATEVAKEVREATIQEVKNEIERLQTELVPNEELELVKSYLLGQLLKAADGPYAMLDLFSGVELHGMDISFYNKYIQKVQEITAEDIREMACKHLDWKSLSIISVG
ncbi:MAG: insulinase family protein [Crocinitomicaceae bacterium]|nr:insulinase family protein [Crocinitomicaceae bacterium]